MFLPASSPIIPWRASLLGLLFLAFGCCCLRAEEIDRLLAAVNGKVITDADLKMARSLNALVLPGASVESPSASEELNRLIDLELMQQELTNYSMGQEHEAKIEARMQQLRNIYAEKFPALLQKLGLQESELVSYLRLQESIMRFVNFRFRPFVSVSEEDKEKYYREKLIPQLRKSSVQIPPFEEVSQKIEIILREEKVNAALEQWIRDIRSNSRIEYFNETNDRPADPQERGPKKP